MCHFPLTDSLEDNNPKIAENQIAHVPNDEKAIAIIVDSPNPIKKIKFDKLLLLSIYIDLCQTKHLYANN